MMRLRKIMACVALMLMATSSNLFAQKKAYITVTGKVNFPPSFENQEKYPFVLKDKAIKDAEVFQTIKLRADSTYEIQVPVKTPRLYSLDVFGWDRITFWAENDDLRIDFRGEDTAKVKIKNPPYVFIESEGKDNQLINILNWEVYQNYQNTIAIGKRQSIAMRNKDTLMTKSLSELMMEQYDNLSTRAKWYAKTYKNDPQVVYALSYLSPRRDQELILGYVESLLVKYPWLNEAQELKNNIKKASVAAKKTEIGAQFINVAQMNDKGKVVKLYDQMKDKKYILVDYWASWCGPCRAENPHILKVYSKYKDKGFDVFAISLDDNKERWLKAIKDDNMPWTQVSDLKGWKNEAAQYYNITSIPSSFLIDNTGKIIARNLRGDMLEKELEKLIK
ncbi:TlpA family protein disulfide reductase [Sphingobacterium bovistauri]|uniref:TlpA family protein disulfide reductase n=1 Tax=Sphingobacterium bovistauri TaxID=2781959 RepID=A0ABS7Z6J3_9SPHI|nr:TlpA disulfide reductase family protein [Sphingobacterium bovistauri]MCA5005021.1 TlpA family protein disulfide reductase [Sphingobacterium bovistauri]